ncbi:MAG: hypothetical protein R8J94_05135 [Acidimicrobiia bacterium]|nr:hypothetical protein [Acidimicrobiia bacterium]
MISDTEDLTAAIKAEVPKVRDDLIIDSGDIDAIAWSPTHVEPIYLDPIATTMLHVVDGIASVGTLADEVADVLEISEDIALDQVARVIRLYRKGGLLESKDAGPPVEPLSASSYVPDW